MWKSTGVSGAPDNSSLRHFSAMTRPSWLHRVVRNCYRHAVEQASRRWRGGRRGGSGRTRRNFDFHTGRGRRPPSVYRKPATSPWARAAATRWPSRGCGLCGSQIYGAFVPRHRRDTCSMAWRCRFLTARRSQRKMRGRYALVLQRQENPSHEDHTEAVAILEDVERRFRRTLGDQNPLTATAQAALGNARKRLSNS